MHSMRAGRQVGAFVVLFRCTAILLRRIAGLSRSDLLLNLLKISR